MTETTAAPPALPVEAPKLSRRGLIAVMAVFMGTPLVIIAAVAWTLPPTSDEPLEASIAIVDFLDVSAYRQWPESQKQDLAVQIVNQEFLPSLLITNTGEVEWSNFSVMVNGVFEFFLADPLAPGEQERVYLHRLLSRQGDLFRPLEWQVQKVKLAARLPSHERAFYECEFDEHGRLVP